MIESHAVRWRSLPGRQRGMIVGLFAAVGLANIAQPFPHVAPLQHIPTLLLLVAAPWLLSRWPLSDRAVGAIAAFLLLHTFAARWTYSNVPYDAWSQALTGQTIGALFGTTRNGFDRLVHFGFGLLAVAPMAEAMRRHAGTSVKIALCIAFLFVGAVSAMYEVVEWGLSMMVSANLAADYNGQQGDVWDAQKDMALALAGSLLSIMWLRRSKI